MPKTIGNIVSKLLSPIKKAWKYLDDKATVTDLLSLFIIALGMVLIIGGLTLTILDTSFGGLSSQSGFTAGTAASTINLVPGIPFFTGDLASTSLTMVGLVSWVLGIDFLLIGLGIWVRHKLARLLMLSIFLVSFLFQFVQFMLLGYMGSPSSILDMVTCGFLSYLLFSKFDSEKANKTESIKYKKYFELT